MHGNAAIASMSLFERENRFSRRTAITLSLIVLIGFGTFDLLAAIDPRKAPWTVHLHAAAMVSWLGVFVAQNFLASGRNLALHRKLGWLALGFAALVVGSGWLAGYAAIARGTVAPVFTPAYFFALILVMPTLFAIMIGAGIARRRQTDWHRRLMLGSLLVILEPLIGRLTIMGFMIGMGGPEPTLAYLTPRPWLAPVIECALQLGVVAVVVWRDMRIVGYVHPAWRRVSGAVVALYSTNGLLAVTPPFVALTRSVWQSWA